MVQSVPFEGESQMVVRVQSLSSAACVLLKIVVCLVVAAGTELALSGANLTDANLTNANLTNAIWSNTTCPDGSNSDATGRCRH
jgi:uncharacterized protein YjbI with pentapeptide repeats